MRPIVVLFMSCGALALLAVVAFVVPIPEGLMATPHGRFSAMLTSGTPFAGSMSAIGALVAVLVVAAMGASVLFGVPQAPAHFKRTLLVMLAGYALIMLLLVASQGAWDDGARNFVLGFPAPTAWLVYGVWLYPWVIMLHLLYGFGRWYWREEDEARFGEILDRHNAADHN